jgi:hypothetical protein
VISGSISVVDITSVRLQPWKRQGTRFDILLKTNVRVFSFMGASPDEVNMWVESIRAAVVAFKVENPMDRTADINIWSDAKEKDQVFSSASAVDQEKYGVFMATARSMGASLGGNMESAGSLSELMGDQPELSDFVIVNAMGLGIYGAVSIVKRFIRRNDKFYFMFVVEQNMSDKVFERVILPFSFNFAEEFPREWKLSNQFLVSFIPS